VSVINKMLRDLDSRQAEGAMPVPGAGPVVNMTRGTFTVDPVTGKGSDTRRRVLPWLAMLLMLLALAAVGAWWLYSTAHPNLAPALPATAVKSLATAAPVPASAPVAPAASAPLPAASALLVAAAPPTASAAASAPAASVSAPPAVAAVGPASAAVAAAPAPVVPALTPPVAVARPLPTPGPAPNVTPAPVAITALAAASSPAKPVAMTSAAVAKTTAPSVAVTAKPAAKPEAGGAVPAAANAAAAGARTPQAAAMETLAQAQSLWNSGSREAARDTLRDAVAAAERANLAAAPGGLASFALLVRELCRMELAEGQVGQVLTLLARLEPQLADQPEVWALRGNAAQRLGRHQESANAYLAALKLRPSEGRWMLGAAVSLAALGQTTAAADWADKARAAGAATPEVLSYLRQSGVPLRER
jgi:hypothetical protein